MITEQITISSSKWELFGRILGIWAKFSQIVRVFLALSSLTSFNHAPFQIVAKFLSESEFFSLAPLLMLQVRSQTNAFSNK